MKSVLLLFSVAALQLAASEYNVNGTCGDPDYNASSTGAYTCSGEYTTKLGATAAKCTSPAECMANCCVRSKTCEDPDGNADTNGTYACPMTMSYDTKNVTNSPCTSAAECNSKCCVPRKTCANPAGSTSAPQAYKCPKAYIAKDLSTAAACAPNSGNENATEDCNSNCCVPDTAKAEVTVAVPAGSKSLPVASNVGFQAGKIVVIDCGKTPASDCAVETNMIASVSRRLLMSGLVDLDAPLDDGGHIGRQLTATSIQLLQPLKYKHPPGSSITSSNLAIPAAKSDSTTTPQFVAQTTTPVTPVRLFGQKRPSAGAVANETEGSQMPWIGAGALLGVTFLLVLKGMRGRSEFASGYSGLLPSQAPDSRDLELSGVE